MTWTQIEKRSLTVKQTHETSYHDTPHTGIHMGSVRFPFKLNNDDNQPYS